MNEKIQKIKETLQTMTKASKGDKKDYGKGKKKQMITVHGKHGTYQRLATVGKKEEENSKKKKYFGNTRSEQEALLQISDANIKTAVITWSKEKFKDKYVASLKKANDLVEAIKLSEESGNTEDAEKYNKQRKNLRTSISKIKKAAEIRGINLESFIIENSDDKEEDEGEQQMFFNEATGQIEYREEYEHLIAMGDWTQLADDEQEALENLIIVPVVFPTDLKEKEPEIIEFGGGTYNGEIISEAGVRLPNGIGEWLKKDDKQTLKYKGTFRRGAFNGHGKYAVTDSKGKPIKEYDGGFNNGEFEGVGSLHDHRTGCYYEGSFKAGKFSGNGTLVEKDGTKLTGIFRDGKLHGKTLVEYKDGRIDDGEFRKGMKHGLVTEYDTKGNYNEIEYKNGVYHGKFVEFKANKDGEFSEKETYYIDGKKSTKDQYAKISEKNNPEKLRSLGVTVEDFDHAKFNRDFSGFDYEKLSTEIENIFGQHGVTYLEKEFKVSDESFAIKFKNGNNEIVRSFRKDVNGNIYANHDFFRVDKEISGKGISKTVMKSFIDQYEEMGVKKIGLSAGLSRGAYVWSKYGFCYAEAKGGIAVKNRFFDLTNETDAGRKASKVRKFKADIGENRFNELMSVLENFPADQHFPMNIIADIKGSSGNAAKDFFENQGFYAHLDLADERQKLIYKSYIDGSYMPERQVEIKNDSERIKKELDKQQKGEKRGRGRSYTQYDV